MKIDLNRVLSSEVIKIFEDGGFNIESTQIYPDSTLSGPIYFLVYSTELPYIKEDYYDVLSKENNTIPYDILKGGAVNGSDDLTIEINKDNEDHNDFDYLIVPKFIKCIENLNISRITNDFTGAYGCGLYGLSDDMRERYNFIEGIVLKLKDIQDKLVQNMMNII